MAKIVSLPLRTKIKNYPRTEVLCLKIYKAGSSGFDVVLSREGFGSSLSVSTAIEVSGPTITRLCSALERAVEEVLLLDVSEDANA